MEKEYIIIKDMKEWLRIDHNTKTYSRGRTKNNLINDKIKELKQLGYEEE